MNQQPHDANPYAAPAGAVLLDSAVFNKESGLRDAPAILPWGAGSRWFAAGWQLFKRAPGKLVGIALLYVLLIVLMSLVPIAGDIASTLLSGVWVASWMIIFAKVSAGEPLPVATLFDGFVVPARGKLLMLGLIYLGGLVALMIVGLLAFLAVAGLNPLAADAEAQFVALFATQWPLLMFAVVFFFVAIFVIYAFIAYAPALLVFHEVPLPTACVLSARGFLGNWRAMTVFGLLAVLWALLGVLTFFIGFVVLLPVITGAYYVSYRQIFVEGEAA
jgi:uncharacterized membrane protein